MRLYRYLYNERVPTCAGEMAEWLKAHAWKACLGETLTWVRIPLSPPFKHSAVSNQPKQTPRRFLCAEAKPRLKSVSNQRCIVGIGTSWRRRVLVWPALLAILLFVPGSASAQVDASSGQSGSSNKQSQSLGDSLRHGGRKQLQ